MQTSELANLVHIAWLAKRTTSDREVKYTWRNDVLDKTYHEPNDAGEQLVLRLSHDSKRKHYIANLSAEWWQPATGFTVTLWSPFDRENYPSGCVLITPVARYSDKSFTKFEKDVLDILTIADSESVVGNLLNRIHSYQLDISHISTNA